MYNKYVSGMFELYQDISYSLKSRLDKIIKSYWYTNPIIFFYFICNIHISDNITIEKKYLCIV